MNFISKITSLVSSTPSTTAVATVDQMALEDLTASLSVVQKQSKHEPDLLDICVSINHPTSESNSRGPADICCVIDVSGSMTSPASVSDTEDAGLSVLDVVKHAVNTITKSLSSQDRLSVVTFSDEAKVVFANVLMDEAGKAKATTTVNQLGTEGRTNLWAGLLRGMDILHAANEDSSKSNAGQRNTSLFLLTDGVPNVNPSEGYVKAMQRFRDQHGGYYPGSIHTFGFGYSLKSALLNEIATEGNGTYNFIPDSGFVGTAFVNTLASQLSSYGFRSTLSLQLLDDDATMVEDSLLPNGSHVPTSWGVNFNVGTLLLGQKRDFVIQVRLPPQNLALSPESAVIVPHVEATLQYRPMFIPQQEGISITQDVIDMSEYGLKNLEVQIFRTSLVRDLTVGYKLQNSPTAEEALLLSEMEAWYSAMKPSVRQAGVDDFTILLEYVDGLMKDLSGQVRMAHTQPAHDKWGTHYIPSLRCAHQRQQCNNFKDPGVQLYGGTLFRQIRDMADEVFLSLPPPKPSRYTNSWGYGGASRAAAPVNMSAYHNAAAGCFAGCGQVTMMDGSMKLVSDIVPGDYITCDLATSHKKEAATAVVECVVRTKCTSSLTAEFVEVSNGLLLTPWHPVWHDDKWQFPIDISGGIFQVLSAEYVYNFVLGVCDGDSNKSPNTCRGQSMVVNGVKCITLAHGIDNDPVASHEFYGTDRVLRALQQYQGYEEGLVVMDESQVQRDNTTGLVCGFATQQCESE